MAIRGEGMADGDSAGAAEGSSAEAGKIVYVLHPNCAIEDV
jgi:DNA replication licensing factor MCM6